MLARASTKTFVSRVRKTAKKASLAEKFVSRGITVFQCMLERTDAITNEVLESVTFVLAYPTVPGTFSGG